ncbi:MAG TPA: protease [Gammaproteobacteria bacterium]|jgi:tricorn protease|nr:PDZ domain-containing protein [Gammaproteobacteria bacterium]MDP6732774.1 PDZ domain-containing protein [Gammaproteobacteria bacterium]HAJ75775.1 protease [Gammaproteobacteria bacterium]|tara:strand:+ start:2629 stop:5982 length:3354 start_codon:yes stop_codon:yes gene_type:complete
MSYNKLISAARQSNRERLLILIAALGFGGAALADGTQLLRQPTVSDDNIAFVHANDLWIVGREGGNARRLTTAEGGETDPKFSPDGAMIAFTAQYHGNRDVYVVSAQGGEPARLTWHPGDDTVMGWTADGSEILFRSPRKTEPTRLWTFFTVPLEGGLPEAMAIPQAYDGEISEDGRFVAYQEIGFWDPEWRNHRGGQAKPISIVDLQNYERILTPRDRERHMSPVWMDGQIYYLSEADWASNIWRFNPDTGANEQLSFHWQFDVKDLDAGSGVVIYEQGGYLHELDPATGESRQLEIYAEGDLNFARRRWENITATGLRNASLSPSGQRALFEHRGEILTVPVEEGSWRNLTNNSGAAERHPAWSTDGQQIAYFSDESGEYQLVLTDQTGIGEARVIPIPEPTFFFQPVWAPGDSHIAFTDTDMRLLVLDVVTEEVVHVDTERYAHPERTMQPVWSPDGKWVAYARRLDNHHRAVFSYNVDTQQNHQITDGMADVLTPVWDAGGDYLWFLASTNFGLNVGWLDMTSYDRPVTYALYVGILDADGASPLLPKAGDEPLVDAPSDSPEEADGDENPETSPRVLDPIDFDVDGFLDRVVATTLPQARYQGLVPGPEGSVFVLQQPADVSPGNGGPQLSLKKFSIQEQKIDEFGQVQFAATSHDRSKLLTRSGQVWRVLGTDRPPRPANGSGEEGGTTLDVAGLRVQIDPKAEWAQLLRESWRYMRDFLYVDNQHGAPWDEIWEWYSPWLEHVRHRSDLNYVMDIVSGEIAVGHSYVRGGDYPDIDNIPIGLLGADLINDQGGIRIDRIFTGENWNPELTAPLAIPGIDVKVGDYLIAVNGFDVSSAANPFELFEGTAGQQVQLLINDSPSRQGAREVIVEPIENENQLRTWAWIEHNRRVVDEVSDGQLAYVWLPNTGQGGYENFNRLYFAQQNKRGAVIDERNNGGGSAADYIVDLLARDLNGYFNSPVGDRKPFTQPIAGLFGPKVMIVNGRAGSGGDLMPYLFRLQGVGPLIGTRTWGGLVGTWDTPPLLDGGNYVAPRGGFFDVDGKWAVEAEGVEPDIWVEQEPKAVIDGGDPQLEAAVAEALRLLETEGVELAPEPAAPIRWRRPERRSVTNQ